MKRRGKIALIIAGGPFTPPTMEAHEEGEERPPADAVMRLFPSLQDSTIEVVDWGRQPSSHYTIRITMDLIELCRKLIQDGVEGIVVYSGTDMLEEMAYLTDLLWVYPQPLIFTGAFRGWETLDADAAGNLYNALVASLSRNSWGLGALLCFQEELFCASEVTKEYSFKKDGFAAPGPGPVGELVAGELLIHRRPNRPSPMRESVIPARAVEAVYASLGTGDRVLKCLADDEGLEGLVLAGFGSGSVPPSWLPYVRSITKRDVPVALTSRCQRGIVQTQATYEASPRRLLEMGVLNGGNLRPLQCKIRLAVGIGAKMDSTELQRYLLD
ncbi:MAG: asparaginase [Synergistales bacterium]|nr:asparaginase [Synergistales bacterium]